MILTHQSLGAARDFRPPAVERLAIAMQLHAHAIGKFDPFGEAMRRHRDDHRDVARERALDQISEPLALALLLAEPVDDDEIGALVDGVGYLRARIEQLSNIE